MSLTRKPPASFSLIEVVIAIAILSVGLVGSMRVFPMGLRASRRAERVSRAVMAAERAIESLKLVSWDHLGAGESTSTDGEYEVTTAIDQPTVEGLVDSASLKRVSVTVHWPQEGRSRTLVLMTYLRRPPSNPS